MDEQNVRLPQDRHSLSYRFCLFQLFLVNVLQIFDALAQLRTDRLVIGDDVAFRGDLFVLARRLPTTHLFNLPRDIVNVSEHKKSPRP